MKIDDAGLRAAMIETRKVLDQDVRAGLLEVAEEVALPVARRLAPSRSGELQRSLTAKGSAKGAYLTTSLRGTRGRRVGLLEYGGTVKRAIEPRKRRALRLASGDFVARVDTPRVYPAQRFLQRSVEDQAPRIRVAVEEAMTAAVIRHMERNGLRRGPA